MEAFEKQNEEAFSKMKLGDRCEVQLSADSEVKRRGCIRFLGKLSLFIHDGCLSKT